MVFQEKGRFSIMKSTLNSDIDYNKLPEPIVKSLTELIARIKLILWIRGSLATLAVVLVVILIVMGIDAATIIISPIYRWGLSLSVLASLIIASYFYLYKPLTQPFSLERVARFVELRHPELQERMSSIVELCRIDENSDDFGSQTLIDKLAQEATFDAANVKPTQEINTKSVKPWFIAAGIVVGITVLLMAIWPLRTFRLIARVMVPSSDVGSFFADNLQVEPGHLRIVKGEPLTIKVKTKSPQINTAYMIKFEAGGKLVKERMIESFLDPDIEGSKGLRVFTLSIPQVNESFRYCIHAGHSLTARYEIQAEVPPQVDRFDFVYKYPSYTGLGTVLSTNASGNINVLNGTEINISANLSKPINSAKFIIGGRELAETNITYITQMRLKCSFVVPPSIDDKWHLDMVDHFSFTNTPKIYSIVSVKDQPPTVDIYRPIEKDLTLSPKGRFVINYFAFDDYGLTNAFLEVSKDGKEPDIHNLKKLEKEKDKEGIWQGNIRFDLSKFDLKNVSKLSLVVCVVDTLPIELGGPQIARSLPIFVTIDRAAEALSRQSYEMQHEAIEKILENILKRLEASVADTKSINAELSDDRPDYVKVDEKAMDIASDLSTVTDILDDLLGLLGDTVYASMKDGVTKAKERGVNVAKQNAEMLVMLDKDDKKATGRKLRTSLEDSIMMIKSLFEDLAKLDEIVEKWLATEELSNKQDDLVEDAKDMVEEGNVMDEDWIKDQKAIAEQIIDVLSEENPQVIKDKLEEVKKAAEKLAKDAEELSVLQDKLAEATKDESLEKLKDAVSEALAREESSEKWEESMAGLEEGDFDKAMAKAQEAIDDQAKDLLKDAKELEAIGDMLTDDKELTDANRNVSDLAEKAKQETDKASEMADKIEENSSKVEKAQQAALAAQSEAQEAQAEAFKAQSEAESAINEAKIGPSEETVAKAQETQEAASEAQEKALEAQESATAAQAEAAKAQEEMAEKSSAAEKSEAQKAQEAAAEAQVEAAAAQAEAESAQKEAESAMNEAKTAPSEETVSKAQKAQEAASEAQEKALKAQESATAAQAEAQEAEENHSLERSDATPEEQQAMQGQQEKAAEALSEVSEGIEVSKSALEKQIEALNEKIEAQAQAASDNQSQPPMDSPMDHAMQAALQAALDAQEAMDISEMMPQSEASQAQEAAQQAQAKALEAMTEAEKAQAEAMASEPSEASKAQADAAKAQDAAAEAQAEAEAAQAAAQAALESHPPSPEISAAQHAQSEAQAAQAEASQLQNTAAESQASAQEAMASAVEAPSDEAAAFAQQAQAEAAAAQAEAKAAQQAAQQAQSQAQQATQQADAAMMQAQQAIMQAQAAQQALSEMMSQQAQQLGMSQEQMQSMASMNQPQSKDQSSPGQEASDNAQNKPEKLETGLIDLELLKNIGLSLEDWEKIKGGLKSGVTMGSDFDNVPAEYRALVRDYFREIAIQVQEQ